MSDTKSNFYNSKATHINNRSNIINTIILLVYVILQITLAVNHEAWRDESQAWILAKNSTLDEIFGLCSSEGHPVLWFLIIKVCTLIGLPFHLFSIVSVVIMGVAVSVFLWKAPFGIISKVLVITSPLFFYYNAVICRIYAVVVLLFVLLCSVWESRRKYPVLYAVIVALLFQTHILVSGIAIGCLLEMIFFDKHRLSKTHVLGISISTISFLLMIIELKQTSSSEVFRHVGFEHIKEIIYNREYIMPLSSVFSKFSYEGIPIGRAIFFLFLFMLIILVALFLNNSKYRLAVKEAYFVFLFGAVVYWGIIYSVRPSDHIQMSIVFWLIMFFVIWTSIPHMKMIDVGIRSTKIINSITKHIVEILFVISCLIVVPLSAWIDPQNDLYGYFSGSKETADFIEQNIPDQSVVVIRNNEYSTGVVAYLYDSDKDIQFWDIDNACEYKIHKWGRKNFREIDDSSLYKYINEDLNENINLFFVDSGQEISNFDNEFVLLFSNSKENMWKEYYYVYKVKGVT